MLREACRQSTVWAASGVTAPGTYVAVNVSARQLDDPGWLKSVDNAIQRTGIPPQYLDLEITESMLVGNPQNVIDTLDTLAAVAKTCHEARIEIGGHTVWHPILSRATRDTQRDEITQNLQALAG